MMVKDVYYGKTLRKSYARHQEILDMPNLLEGAAVAGIVLPDMAGTGRGDLW